MYIEKLLIKNFRSYCGVKEFTFTKGLNLIIGANGDGKSTFYDALYWAFSDDDGTTGSKVLSQESQISAKMFKELPVGSTEEVRVEVFMVEKNQRGDLEHKSVYKRFSVKKMADGKPEVSEWMHHSKLKGPKTKDKDDFTASFLLGNKDGSDGWFPALIRKYSMFQGEAALKIFDETDNLRNLITLFSDIKDLTPIKGFSRFAKETSNKAINRTLNKDKQDRGVAEAKLTKDLLESHLKRAKEKLTALQKTLELQSDQLEDVESIMDDIEHVHNLKLQIEQKKRLIDPEVKYLSKNSNFVLRLLSDKWILSGYLPILEQYLDKMNEFSQKRTQFLSLYEIEKEKLRQKKADAAARENLQKQIKSLPWYVPDTKTMESMLKQHRCFVCNREMCEHDDAYKFMQDRLNEALRILNPEPVNKEQFEEIPYPFKDDNIGDLHASSSRFQRKASHEITGIPEAYRSFNTQYKEIQGKVQNLRSDLLRTENELKDYIAQRNTGVDLMSMSESMGEWKSKSRSKEVTETEIHKLVDIDIPKLEEDLAKARVAFDKAIEKSGKKVGIEDINELFELLCDVLDSIENDLYNDIITGINEIGNEYLAKLNIDDFTGRLEVRHDKVRNKFELNLYNSDGIVLKAPNTSLKTTMYISALLAISDMSQNHYAGQKDFPMIFDAPTSSFDAGKDRDFYELFSKEIKKQVIIVTKSYLLKDLRTGQFVLDNAALQRITCPIYRIQKLSGFDKKDLTTIDTQIIKI